MTSIVTTSSHDSNSISTRGLCTISHPTNLARFQKPTYSEPWVCATNHAQKYPLYNYCRNEFDLKRIRKRVSF